MTQRARTCASRRRSRATADHRATLEPRNGSGEARTKSEEVIARSKDPKLGTVPEEARVRRRGDAGAGRRRPSPDGNSFVIQWHDATRLHHDFRLERDGVLVSWAVPKGLPVGKGEKHLAVQTEDHPMEYGTFAGVDPGGPLRRRRGPHLGQRHLRPAGVDRVRRSASGLHGRRHTGEYHLIKTAARLARLPGEVLRRPAARAAADALADAGRGRARAVRPRGLAVRAEARRHPDAAVAATGRRSA